MTKKERREIAVAVANAPVAARGLELTPAQANDIRDEFAIEIGERLFGDGEGFMNQVGGIQMSGGE